MGWWIDQWPFGALYHNALSCQIHVIISSATLVIFLTFWRGWQRMTRLEDLPSSFDTHSSFAKPLFFPCETAHTRHFPKRHSFCYSYLLVGIPVGMRSRVGPVLSVDSEARNNWFTISADNYLQRGYSPGGLSEKLHSYLLSQCCDPSDYPFAYLVTAPAFLGYSFNPVSFWYLYSHEKILQAMILEVNNTFDERHMYFVKPKAGPVVNGIGEKLVNSQSYTTDHLSSLRSSWKKEFYVSPFNNRDGFYTFMAIDPLANCKERSPTICNTVVLNSAGNKPKLTASVASVAKAIDPSLLTGWDAFKFVITWWWAGLVTFPRILREAAKLFIKRRLKVWRRPVVTENSITRHADSSERSIERCFHSLLEWQVRHAKSPLRVKYTSCAGNRPQTEYISSLRCAESEDATNIQITDIDINILSPDFYRHFIRYEDPFDAIEEESAGYAHGQATVRISNLELLKAILSNPKLLDSATGRDKAQHMRPFDSWRWRLLARCRQFTSLRRHHVSGRSIYASRARNAPDSVLDSFAKRYLSVVEAQDYRRACLTVILTDEIGFGFPLLLQIYDFCLRCALAFASMQSARSAPATILGLSGSWRSLLFAGTFWSSLHAWAFLKSRL
ncbi:hypothetical protein L228DRAFT_251564 [Xylona heveae TC161]|uniref:DUF1365-domain-containing protein n=1 Tax=Xylona heveae (strain CBS 132557 / TC161) TaxID=1328760 RepID=A0A164ZET0_XYLHT|nr:hypothetical protein L228DRAFT_251564 [Xylona heveae TC161]KZF19012.1 hypothetical protein L228DRAFT_251564 [Xylona heveae TC161]